MCKSFFLLLLCLYCNINQAIASPDIQKSLSKQKMIEYESVMKDGNKHNEKVDQDAVAKTSVFGLMAASQRPNSVG